MNNLEKPTKRRLFLLHNSVNNTEKPNRRRLLLFYNSVNNTVKNASSDVCKPRAQRCVAGSRLRCQSAVQDDVIV